MQYLATHRTLLITYLRTVSFQEASIDIYDSPMSAICSAFQEIMESTSLAVGASTDFEVIKKECMFHRQGVFQDVLTNWVEK